MSKNVYRMLAILSVIATTAGAAQWVGPENPDGPIGARDLEHAAKPLAAGENINVTPLTRTEHSTNVLVQIRGAEPLHYHADSDITVWIVRGQGTILIGDQSYPVKPGDSMHIPRGVIHKYSSTGKTPGLALVVMSPPPGPEDRVLVQPKK